MKKILFAIAAVAAMSMASVASANDFYVKAEVGQGFDTQVGPIETDNADIYGAYIGTAVGPFRVEAGVAHLDAEANLFGLPVNMSANDFNATAYLDTASGLYIGAGANYVQGEATVFNAFSVDQSGYGYHVSGGYAFAAAGGIVELQATYRDIELDDVDLSGTAVTVAYRHAL